MTACNCTDSNSCNLSGNVVENKKIEPITAAEPSTGAFTVEYTVHPKNGRGKQSASFSGETVGDTADERKDSVYASVVNSIVDMLSSMLVGYAAPAAAFDDSTNLASLAAFQTYLIGANPASMHSIINYTGKELYPTLISLGQHVEVDNNPSDPCADANSRLFRSCDPNCLFKFLIVYN